MTFTDSVSKNEVPFNEDTVANQLQAKKLKYDVGASDYLTAFHLAEENRNKQANERTRIVARRLTIFNVIFALIGGVAVVVQAVKAVWPSPVPSVPTTIAPTTSK